MLEVGPFQLVANLNDISWLFQKFQKCTREVGLQNLSESLVTKKKKAKSSLANPVTVNTARKYTTLFLAWASLLRRSCSTAPYWVLLLCTSASSKLIRGTTISKPYSLLNTNGSVSSELVSVVIPSSRWIQAVKILQGSWYPPHNHKLRQGIASFLQTLLCPRKEQNMWNRHLSFFQNYKVICLT